MQTKILALLVAVLMIAASMAAVADPKTVTLNVNDTTHTYKVFQLLTGELLNGKLAKLEWGQNSGKTGSLTDAEVKALEDTVKGIKAEATDQEILSALNGYIGSLKDEDAFKTITNGSVEVPTGYYLIKDADGVALDKGDEHTLYMLAVVDSTTITRKASTTSSDKTVGDINDSEDETTTTGLISSDYDIGDPVPYHLTATLSQKIGQYKKYHIDLHDTLQKGSFSDISDLTIKMDGAAIAETADYTVSITGADAASVNGFDVTIEFTPKEDKTLAALAGKTITVDFTATLGEGAKIGAEGNTNKFYIEYSNNPNDDQGGEEGTTPEVTVITFTYKVVVNKVDENKDPLTGATFALYKIPADTEEPTDDDAKDTAAKNAYYASKAIKSYTNTGDDPQFEFKGVDDGTYVLCETGTPDGYNPIAPKVFEITADHTSGTNGLTLEELTGDGDIELKRDESNEDALTTDIMNQSGTQLPSTGGIGTTIFYVAGSILVLAAAILLITKRRMGAEE